MITPIYAAHFGPGLRPDSSTVISTPATSQIVKCGHSSVNTVHRNYASPDHRNDDDARDAQTTSPDRCPAGSL